MLASFAAALTASSSPPSASTILSDSACVPENTHPSDGVVDLLRGAHHPARAVDADDHGLDAGIVAVLPQFAHKIVGLGDEPFELDDRDFGAEERAAVAATAAPRATDEQEEPDHPAQHEHGGHQHRQPTAHLFLVVVVVVPGLAALAALGTAAAAAILHLRRRHGVGELLEA